jgi:hypothetical protein
MFSRFWHRLAAIANRPAYRSFRRAVSDPQRAQRERLGRLLRRAVRCEVGRHLDPAWDFEQYAQRVPLSRYEDTGPLVARQREHPELSVMSRRCDRFVPTSGSTSRRKWIPYSAAFRAELDAAAGAWLADLGRRFPAVLSGRHYWSLSWLPEDLRGTKDSNDDLEILPAWKRFFLARMMAVPPDVQQLPTSEECLRATLVHLASTEDLTLISVWSPTFLLRLLDRLASERQAIADRLPRGSRSASILAGWDGRVDAAFLAELWPRLALVSAWDSATSVPWAAELRRLFPGAAFQGKGLWATEGVVTIPFRGDFPLALTSHVLEFRCLVTERILAPWELEIGQALQPILSTGSGLLRYLLDDRVRVTGFLERCPCLAFEGRLGGADMVGEKLDAGLASEVLATLDTEFDVRPISLLGVPADPPRYRLLAVGDAAPAALAARLEELLAGIHHYRVARELHQLAAAELDVRADALAHYYECLTGAGRTEGEGKVEPVLVVADPGGEEA